MKKAVKGNRKIGKHQKNRLIIASSKQNFQLNRVLMAGQIVIFEPLRDKTNKMTVRPASAQSDRSLRCPHEESLGP